MGHYSYVCKEMLKPEKQLGSVIDAFDVIGQILERVQKFRDGKHVSEEDAKYIIANSMFSLGFFSFWQAHGAVMRPLMMQALSSDGDVIENFFVEAIPTALTIAMPNRQMEYQEMRDRARELFKE